MCIQPCFVLWLETTKHHPWEGERLLQMHPQWKLTTIDVVPGQVAVAGVSRHLLGNLVQVARLRRATHRTQQAHGADRQTELQTGGIQTERAQRQTIRPSIKHKNNRPSTLQALRYEKQKCRC